MNKERIYFFILGTNRTLTTLDILVILKKQKIVYEILESSEEVLVIKTGRELDVSSLIKELGSSQKIGVIFGFLPMDNFADNFQKEIQEKEFVNFLFSPDLEKVNFGISLYEAGSNNLGQISHGLNNLCNLLKKELKKQGKKAGYLLIKERSLSSVAVEKQHLLNKGFELVLLAAKDKIYLGKTLAVQDFESYSLRDFGRPARDSKAGMLPPKLAKMMINLAEVDKNAVMLDPFCGSGTILQEAILLGYKNLLGSDKEEKAVSDTKQNLDWLFKNYLNKVCHPDPDVASGEGSRPKIKQAPVENLSDYYSPNSIDAIITEPFLGNPGVRFFNEDKLKKEIGFLEELYFQSFKEFKKILKPNGVVVIVFPVFNFFNKTHYLTLARILKMGFFPALPIEEKVVSDLKLNITPRTSVIFSRPDQTIWREIFVFDRKNGL